MEYIVTEKEMKQYDANTINYFQMESAVLMERAALSVVDAISEKFSDKKRVLIVAGTGNNGGDGFAIGRILWQRGLAVSFVLLGKKENCSNETKKQIEILERYGLPIETNLPDKEYDIIVDAIFGIGLSREIKGIFEEAVTYINQSNAKVVAVDIPSGVSAKDGSILGTAVKADMTVTFAFKKLGLLLYPGAEYCGELLCTDIGISKESFLGEKPCFISYTKEDLTRLPIRKKNGNKGTFGKVLVIAGSENMCGAAQFAALSAYRMGSGMVRIFTVAKNREILQKNIPEALLTTYDADNFEESLLEEALRWATVVVLGPGLGTTQTAEKIVNYVLNDIHIPTVIDADALNIIAGNEALKKKIQGKPVVLTPHLMEFARLTGKNIEEVKENRVKEALAFAKENQVTLVCKDAVTIVSNKGENNYINQTGNESMATAGSGDVLAGIIAALIGQGMTVEAAAALGVYTHGLAGDMAKQESNSYYVMAGNLIEQLAYILKENKNETL